MGKKKKLIKFAEVSSFANVFEHDEAPKGAWDKAFEKKQPLVLELACGKGEYTIGLAKMFPNKNFLGLDIKGNRIWRGAKTALEENLKNAAFLRCQINRITDHFEANEVSEIWITFADPHPRDGKAKKRLTHPNFLELYQQISCSPLIINLKTDSDLLYAFTKEVIAEKQIEPEIDCNDVYTWDERPQELNIQTYYEHKWLDKGIKIKYLRFKLQ
ncbi:MAG: tRNA (guanosine(46)-N7)-methyltransferase TrmB [Flavobacteriales bacterium]|nr:tRNA (guanosine(46)-N7)-methyltransferase TrmB [Flavobacteriales bacterium]